MTAVQNAGQLKSLFASIVIAGGSLAGISCAIRLKQLGHQPLVIEKSRFPRKKLCGEFLGPDAFPVLQKLGIFQQVQAHAYGPVEDTYFHDRHGRTLRISHAWISKKYPYALAIPRDILDHLLFRHAQDLGVTTLEERRILSPVEHDGHQFQIHMEARSDDNQIKMAHVTADYLLDGTGRNGKLYLNDEPLRTNQNPHRVGIQCHVQMPCPLPDKNLHMFLFAGGYGGLQPVSADIANLCMMVEPALAKQISAPFETFISGTVRQNPAAARLLAGAKQENGFSVTADINLFQPDPNHAVQTSLNLIRIGDALVTVDPFSGSGMSHALESGVMAAEAIDEGILHQRDYNTVFENYQKTYNRLFQRRLRMMCYFRPILESEKAQQWLWPVIPPFLPLLAGIFR